MNLDSSCLDDPLHSTQNTLNWFVNLISVVYSVGTNQESDFCIGTSVVPPCITVCCIAMVIVYYIPATAEGHSQADVCTSPSQ